MIANIKGNIMGTVSFDGKFAGMRKPQDFIVYPIPKGAAVDRIKIQSDKRSGYVDVATGNVELYPGQYFMGFAANAGKLDAEELLMLKGAIMGESNENAGKNGLVYVDNGGAAGVFQ